MIIDSLYQMFDETKLRELLMDDCNPMKLLIICNSIENGSIGLFVNFLTLNIIGKIFIPYLYSSQVSSSIQIFGSSLDALFQRDEISGDQFSFVIKAFNTEQFKVALERNLYNIGNCEETNNKIEKILNL